MTLTRNFKETIQARAIQDPEFRAGLFQKSIDSMLAGDTETGRMLLRDYINATIGFEELGRVADRSPKSLMRMFSTKGNPTANNLFGIIHVLQEKEGLRFEVKAS